MMSILRAAATGGVLLVAVLAAGNAFAQKSGGILKMYIWDNPPHMSMLDGPNPLASVQSALGLDRLSVGGGTSTGGAQSAGATVEAGRYVSRRVFVGAKESTTGFSQVQVDVDLSKHLKLQSRLGNGTTTTQGTTPENDPGSSVGLLYQFEY